MACCVMRMGRRNRNARDEDPNQRMRRRGGFFSILTWVLVVVVLWLFVMGLKLAQRAVILYEPGLTEMNDMFWTDRVEKQLISHFV
jgi:hypothetical protein